MSQLPVTRLYATEQQAKDAVQMLTENQLDPQTISMVTPSTIRSGSVQEIADHIVSSHCKWVPENYATLYAERIEAGESLVILDAPFGRGAQIERVLDSFEPLPIRMPLADRQPSGASPLSDALGISVLSDGLSFQAKRKDSLYAWLLGQSEGSSNFLSTSWFPMISKNPAPLSSMLGLRTISKNDDPGDTSFGMPLLSDSAAPLSSKVGMSTTKSNENKDRSFGLPTLSSNPAPLSSAIGMPTLTNSKKSK